LPLGRRFWWSKLQLATWASAQVRTEAEASVAC
jgi:hypothetical protein